MLLSIAFYMKNKLFSLTKIKIRKLNENMYFKMNIPLRTKYYDNRSRHQLIKEYYSTLSFIRYKYVVQSLWKFINNNFCKYCRFVCIRIYTIAYFGIWFNAINIHHSIWHRLCWWYDYSFFWKFQSSLNWQEKYHFPDKECNIIKNIRF